METSPATALAQELEDILADVDKPAVATRRSVLGDYSSFIAAALERVPALTYESIALALTRKLAKDGRVNDDGTPIVVSRAALNKFVLRRKANSGKRVLTAQALAPGRENMVSAPAPDSNANSEAGPVAELDPWMPPQRRVDMTEFIQDESSAHRGRNPLVNRKSST